MDNKFQNIRFIKSFTFRDWIVPILVLVSLFIVISVINNKQLEKLQSTDNSVMHDINMKISEYLEDESINIETNRNLGGVLNYIRVKPNMIYLGMLITTIIYGLSFLYLRSNQYHFIAQKEIAKNKHISYYENLLNEATLLDEELSCRLSKISLWMIRIGIIGTLLGITFSFNDLRIALDLFRELSKDKNAANEIFLRLMTLSIKGNALAIVSSLVAHLCSLLFEVSLFFAPKDIAFKYINKQLTPILSKYGSIEEINTDIDGSLTKLDALDAKVQDSKSNVLKLKVEISEAYKVSKECNGEVQKTLVNATKVKDLTVISKDSSSKIEENISKANASSSLLTSSLDKVHDSLSKLNQSKDIESVGKKSEELQNRIDNISKSVKKTLKELSSLFKNLELDNDQKK